MAEKAGLYKDGHTSLGVKADKYQVSCAIRTILFGNNETRSPNASLLMPDWETMFSTDSLKS